MLLDYLFYLAKGKLSNYVRAALFPSHVYHVQISICAPSLLLLLFLFSYFNPLQFAILFCNAIHSSWAINCELNGYVSSIHYVTITIPIIKNINNIIVIIIIIVIVIIIIMEMLEIVLQLYVFCSASFKRAASVIIWSVCGFFICFPFKLFTQLNTGK